MIGQEGIKWNPGNLQKCAGIIAAKQEQISYRQKKETRKECVIVRLKQERKNIYKKHFSAGRMARQMRRSVM